MTLPTDPKTRKNLPIMTGVLDYFPRAIAAVAAVSVAGNEQHNPGEPLHWAKEKSTDHADSAVRHLMERGKVDVDGQLHSAKAAWRALANLEIELETADADVVTHDDIDAHTRTWSCKCGKRSITTTDYDTFNTYRYQANTDGHWSKAVYSQCPDEPF